jgi:hypothetical protein
VTLWCRWTAQLRIGSNRTTATLRTTRSLRQARQRVARSSMIWIGSPRPPSASIKARKWHHSVTDWKAFIGSRAGRETLSRLLRPRPSDTIGRRWHDGMNLWTVVER